MYVYIQLTGTTVNQAFYSYLQEKKIHLTIYKKISLQSCFIMFREIIHPLRVTLK